MWLEVTLSHLWKSFWSGHYQAQKVPQFPLKWQLHWLPSKWQSWLSMWWTTGLMSNPLSLLQELVMGVSICPEEPLPYGPFFCLRHMIHYWCEPTFPTKANLVPIHMYMLCISKPVNLVPGTSHLLLYPKLPSCSSILFSLPSATHPPYSQWLSHAILHYCWPCPVYLLFSVL